MGIRFGDLYEEMLTLEQAIARMEIDIENADCDSATKCRLWEEWENLQSQYYDLSNTEFDFEKLNFVTIVESIERCLHCIEFDSDFSDLAPPPYGVANVCGSRRIQLTLDDIEKVIVTEGTTQSTVYEFVKSAMPYTILTRASEKYVVTWDSLRKGISVKGFNQTADKSVTNFGNIGKMEVVLTEPAKAKYKLDKVLACKVLLTTNTPMVSAAPLTYAVDGKLTYPRVAPTNKSEVELVFQFFV